MFLIKLLKFSDKLKDATDDVEKESKKIIGGTKDAVDDALDKTTDVIGDVKDKVEDTGKNILDNIVKVN